MFFLHIYHRTPSSSHIYHRHLHPLETSNILQISRHSSNPTRSKLTCSAGRRRIKCGEETLCPHRAPSTRRGNAFRCTKYVPHSAALNMYLILPHYYVPHSAPLNEFTKRYHHWYYIYPGQTHCAHMTHTPPHPKPHTRMPWALVTHTLHPWIKFAHILCAYGGFQNLKWKQMVLMVLFLL